MNQAMLMANGIVPRPLAPYQSAPANRPTRAETYGQDAVTEIQRLEVVSCSFLHFHPLIRRKVETGIPSLKSSAGGAQPPVIQKENQDGAGQ